MDWIDTFQAVGMFGAFLTGLAAVVNLIVGMVRRRKKLRPLREQEQPEQADVARPLAIEQLIALREISVTLQILVVMLLFTFFFLPGIFLVLSDV